jgi:uncharacterized protein (DUF2252 family)
MKSKTKKKTDNGRQVEKVTPVTTGQRDLRRAQGNELRKSCPRSSHAGVILGQTQRDPMTLLEESNRDRVESLIPVRFSRMIESPFAFFRGSAILQAHDLQGTPSAGITVQCCGDCHLANFGGFATPERTMAFDINDFDETLPGPFEWDLKRLATSLILAARWRGFSKSEAKNAAQTAVRAYREAQAHFAELSVLETWYAMITIDEVIKEAAHDAAMTTEIKKEVAKAKQNTSEHVFHKITTVVDGKPRIVDQPPLVYHDPLSEHEFDGAVHEFIDEYRRTLLPDRRALFDRYQVVDGATKVVGVGSVGTRCYVALMLDRQDDYLFLQVKEARESVLQGRAGPCPYTNQGERVVCGQRLMQAASDIFLGWTRGAGGRDFYIRQLRDMKLGANLAAFTPDFLAAYGHLCGQTLARAHAKAGDATMIAGYLGTGDTFDQAIRDYAVGYADQVEKDYETFKEAVHAGRFPTESEQKIH